MIPAGWTGLEPAASGVTGPMVRYGTVRPRSQNPLKSPSFASLSLQLAPSDYIRTRMFWSTDRVQNFLASDCEIGVSPHPRQFSPRCYRRASRKSAVAAYWKRREIELCGAPDRRLEAPRRHLCGLASLPARHQRALQQQQPRARIGVAGPAWADR